MACFDAVYFVLDLSSPVFLEGEIPETNIDALALRSTQQQGARVDPPTLGPIQVTRDEPGSIDPHWEDGRIVVTRTISRMHCDRKSQ